MKILLRVCMVLLAVVCCGALPAAAADAETLYHTAYCFSEADFEGTAELTGIFVTGVPESEVAGIRLGERTIRAGDVLPLEALEQLKLIPACTENRKAVLSYQPIVDNRLGAAQELTVRICSGKNEAPKAFDFELETYKNIANDGKLQASDPEEGALTFHLSEQPKRGTVELQEDGSFVYTPSKNKVGEDVFTFIVTDDAGNESKPATVRIRILKPTESRTFADMDGSMDVFEATWLCSTGLTGGRTIAGRYCFAAEAPVERGEFLAMSMDLLGMEIQEEMTVSGFVDAQEAPAWMQPYFAAAMRRGIISGEVTEAGLVFRPNDNVTNQEAAVMLQNILRLPITAAAADSALPAWASEAVQALSEAGIFFDAPSAELTRLEAAKLLYRVSQMR